MILSKKSLFELLLSLQLALWAGLTRAEVQLVVGTPEQGGQYASVQAAVDAVPASNSERHVIKIMPGTYTERVFVLPDKVTLRGMGASPSDVRLTYFETANTPPNESTVHASTVIRGKDFVAENLTFENSAGQHAGQALAIYARGDRSTFNNCRFLGWQDTLRSESGRHYFYESYIEGSVDFIYGKGQAYFEKSTLYAKASGYITAQGRESFAESNGYVFKDSIITGSAPVGSVYLGRPWQAYSRAVFIDTKMSSIINPAGWQTWSGNNHLTSFFAEYNSMDLEGNPLNVSQRAGWSHQLTAQEVESYSKENWLMGWEPELTLSLSGDFNDDGLVDGTDLLEWQRNLEIGSLNDWKRDFSTMPASISVAVPEPATCSIVILFMAISLLMRSA